MSENSEAQTREGADSLERSDSRVAQSTAPTVSRIAWLFGLAVGLAICAVGFGLVGAWDAGRIVSVGLEFAVVAAALWTTTWIWRRSADGTRRNLEIQEDATDVHRREDAPS